MSTEPLPLPADDDADEESTDAVKDDASIPRSAKKVEEALSLYDAELAARPTDTAQPWINGVYVPDIDALRVLLAIPVHRGDKATTGRLAKAFDAWVAHELRRAGFDEDAVWPRTTAPRVLPAKLAAVDARLSKLDKARVKALARDPDLPKIGGSDNPFATLRKALGGQANASILGDFYEKQVDVVMSSWERGPEILISTKTMVSSFGNNLTNRHEEAVGEIASLRRRHPMAASGFAFLAHENVRNKPKNYARLVDILRRLKRPGAYDATMLVIGSWDANTEGGEIRDIHGLDDEGLGAGTFFADITRAVIDRTPIGIHDAVRERHNHGRARPELDDVDLDDG